MTTLLINVKTTDFDIWKDRGEFLYIGRGNKWIGLAESKWHNPFPMKNESARVKVLTDFLQYMINPYQEDLISDLCELDGKVLGCYCSPKKCHGDILLRLRDLQKAERIEEWETIRDWINS